MGVLEFLFGVIVFIVDVVAIITVLRGPASTGRKILWILAIIFFPVIGVILYFLIGRSRRD
ncbi:MAG: PLDc N-terminal domain-containing protein [Deltaproteobacteria bacterium]|nr:PLDc N-terminal domain-containing protein [Deltaproteobacteria bacterium]